VTAAVRIIERRKITRDYELEKSLRVKDIHAMLEPLIAAGELVHCTVLRPGKPPAHEYRPSSAGAPRNPRYTSSENQLVDIIARHPDGIRTKHLVTETGIKPSALGMVLARMARNKMIQRVGGAGHHGYTYYPLEP